MPPSIKPITYMKTHAADILSTVSSTHAPVIITHNGEGKMVIQDIDSYNATRNALTLLKVAALGRRAVERKKFQPAAEAFKTVRRQRHG